MDRTESETRQFKAEVRQILDIVIHSLYTHREIFIRELVSNAADALEKMRHELLVQKSVADPETPLEIRIETDKDSGTLTIRDTGVGMTADELTSNLGTIARSGTRQFLEQLSEDRRREADLIGRFGVGFYSSSMAATEVRARTRSFRASACVMSILPLRKALRVNSPGSARRAPDSSTSDNPAARMSGFPWQWNSRQSSPV